MDEFAAGFLAGAGIIFGCWWLTSRSFTRYLREKAKYQDRTAVCLGGEFFYVVPEGEYNVLNGLRIEARRVIADWNAGAARCDRDRKRGEPVWNPNLDADIGGRPLKPGS